MVRISLSILFCFSLTSVFAQSQKKTFYNDFDLVVDSAHAVYFVNWINKSPTKEVDDSKVDTLLGYYLQGNKKRSRVLHVRNFKEGDYVYWFPNGQVMEKGTFIKGVKTLHRETWYPNGARHEVYNFLSDAKTPVAHLTAYYDSAGNQMIKNGKGYCRCYFNPEDVRDEGKMAGGLKDSVWQTFKKGTLHNEEVFDNGKFIRGKVFLPDGNKNYTVIEERPEYKGGLDAMNRFIAHNVRYPSDLRKKGTEGKVYVSFVVNRDGSIDDVESIKDFSEIAAAEAVRVVKLMPDWKPGMQRGETVRVKYVVPIFFKLTSGKRGK